ncbi:MAG TPA: hypothetical protein VN764_07510, partial [Polyangiaceae bacterium]|nr:hypothetical protein [Polyangiaceae bacterium]
MTSLFPVILVVSTQAHAQDAQAAQPAPAEPATAEQDVQTPEQAPAEPTTAELEPPTPAEPAPTHPATAGKAASAPIAHEAQAPQQQERKPWTVRDSHLIVGAERLSNVGWVKHNAFQEGEKAGKVSGSEVNFLGVPRLSLDFSWIGTIGVTFGYNGNSMSVENFANGFRTSTKTQGVLIGVRGGVLLDAGAYLSVWLRAGYQYQHAW